MRVKTAIFCTSVTDIRKLPDPERPQIVFAGKSNAGKSSLINYLTNSRKLAYVSKQPGKTRLINVFLINHSFYLTDLPGYGYANVSKSEKLSWSNMMDNFFTYAQNIRGLAVLIDIRRAPAQNDLQMIRFAEYYKIPYFVAATKADKIAKSKRVHYTKEIGKTIAAELGFAAPPVIIPVSSTAKVGGEKLLDYMGGLLGQEASS